MTGRGYQDKAHGFASYGDNPMYPALGLAEEAGEVCGKIAKYIRKHNGVTPTGEYEHLAGTDLEDYIAFTAKLRKELGDVLWMVAELCTVYGLDMNDVMAGNIEKLADRKERGVIVGEGDNR